MKHTHGHGHTGTGGHEAPNMHDALKYGPIVIVDVVATAAAAHIFIRMHFGAADELFAVRRTLVCHFCCTQFSFVFHVPRLFVNEIKPEYIE